MKIHQVLVDINTSISFFRTLCLPLECNLALDLGFALPVSSDIKDMEWKNIQDFVKSTTNAFNVSYFGAHIGLVSYSSLATLELKLNRYYYANDIKVLYIFTFYPNNIKLLYTFTFYPNDKRYFIHLHSTLTI